jgi:RNA ligase (TIGR02306 family)
MKDATIELIDTVNPHPDADRLDLSMVLGYQCVTQKGLYVGGEKIVYIRPDSLLPIELWTESYRKYAPKRIKAVKLRGEVSKGIIVPFEILPQDIQDKLATMNVGDDVSELIGVTHWEEPQPQDLQAKGGLPFGIPKTDEERHENLRRNLPLGQRGDVTLKVDGQSCSFFYDVESDKFGVLGRTFEYHEIFTNNYTAHIERYDIKNKLIEYCKKYNVSLCVRGESYGQGIQSFEINPHSKLEKGWAMFAVWSITDHDHAEKEHPHYFLNVAKETGFPTVPILEEDVEITQELLDKYSKGITKINGKPFEGVVVKHAKGSFKIINDDYDSKK